MVGQRAGQGGKQRIPQLIAAQGLHEAPGVAGGAGPRFFKDRGGGREKEHGSGRVWNLAGYARECIEPAHVWKWVGHHGDAKRPSRGGRRLELVQGFLAGRAARGVHAEAGQLVHQDAAGQIVVVHSQDRDAGQLLRRCGGGVRSVRCRGERGAEREQGAVAW